MTTVQSAAVERHEDKEALATFRDDDVLTGPDHVRPPEQTQLIPDRSRDRLRHGHRCLVCHVCPPGARVRLRRLSVR